MTVFKSSGAMGPVTGASIEDQDLNELIKKSKAFFDALTPEQQEEHMREQRLSWVRGEMGMGNDKDEAAYRDALARNDQAELTRLDAEAEERKRRVG